MAEAARVIRQEHRNTASVLACLGHAVDAIEVGRWAPDFQLLTLVINYLETFPEIFHHPKEEKYLFTALLRRRPEAAPLLERLGEEHILGLEAVIDMRAALRAYRSDLSKFPRFREEVDRYVQFQRSHMQLEEREILPLALEVLTPDDWHVIGAAFARNDDPLFGQARRKHFDALYSRIFELAPRPVDIPESGAALA
jgi:branched-chain amino acid transport system ATP-binding protein